MPRDKFPVGPCGKIVFPAAADAETRVFYLKTIAGYPATTRSYFCAKCNGWNITSKRLLVGRPHQK